MRAHKSERSTTPNAEISPGHACRKLCDARTCTCPPCACAVCRARRQRSQNVNLFPVRKAEKRQPVQLVFDLKETA
jgi:hypothetical protein